MKKITEKAESEGEYKNKHVLIVEDEAFLSKALNLKIGKAGISSTVISDGDEAIKYLKNKPSDLVMLDLMLPGTDGYEILAAIRKNPKWKSVPVIIMSNLAQAQDKQKAEELGIEDYVVKSDTKIAEIMEKILHVLKK